MCLGIPAKIVRKQGPMGTAEFRGVRRIIGLELLEEVKVGDWVILHAGFAIQKLDQEEAMKTLALFKELESVEGE
jgi:hydrogenase expression/formation protein HypC